MLDLQVRGSMVRSDESEETPFQKCPMSSQDGMSSLFAESTCETFLVVDDSAWPLCASNVENVVTSGWDDVTGGSIASGSNTISPSHFQSNFVDEQLQQ